MAVSVNGNKSTTVYGKGDVCLKINPFDNFRMFTLYEDWRSDDRKPMDLSDSKDLYMVFKNKKKEIRIPEYDIIDSNYTVDKVNGQVLFKISKKDAIDILAMDTRTFYITRVYNVTDSSGKKVVSSDEEVLFTGRWKDESENTVENYTSQIKNLMDLLAERNKQISDLMASNARLMEQNVNLTKSVEDLQDANDKMSAQVSELEAKVADYESGTEYAGEVLGEASKYTIIEGKQYTEQQMEEVAKHLEEISRQ